MTHALSYIRTPVTIHMTSFGGDNKLFILRIRNGFLIALSHMCVCREVWWSWSRLPGELHSHRGGESLQWSHRPQLRGLHQPVHQPDRQERQRRTKDEVPAQSEGKREWVWLSHLGFGLGSVWWVGLCMVGGVLYGRCFSVGRLGSVWWVGFCMFYGVMCGAYSCLALYGLNF